MYSKIPTSIILQTCRWLLTGLAELFYPFRYRFDKNAGLLVHMPSRVEGLHKHHRAKRAC